MSVIWTKIGIYKRVAYGSEADLEGAIAQVQSTLFGPNRIYLDVKKKIGMKGRIQNIPDGYLLDLNGHKPRLYVVENELASHDLHRHIVPQLVQFSVSFEEEPRTVKKILFNALQEKPEARTQSEIYAQVRGLRNLDYMLECLVFESKFTVLLIIDEVPQNLQSVLANKLGFEVEILQLTRYESETGERIYQFKPFLSDIDAHFGGGNEVAQKRKEKSIRRLRNNEANCA